MSFAREWDAARADELASTALAYMESVYPLGASFEPLAAYHEVVLATERVGDLEAYENALREWMRAGRRVAMDARRTLREGAA